MRIYGVPGHIWQLGNEKAHIIGQETHFDYEAEPPWTACARCGQAFPLAGSALPTHCLPTAEWQAANPADDGRCHCPDHDSRT